jgi:hypothetical protein
VTPLRFLHHRDTTDTELLRNSVFSVQACLQASAVKELTPEPQTIGFFP